MSPVAYFRPETEFFSEEGCYITEIHNSGEDEGCSIARARVKPGAATKLHALIGTVERYVILEGEGRVEIEGGPPTVVRPLDVVVIPAGASQRISNPGSRDLEFLCVCTPRFTPGIYVKKE